MINATAKSQLAPADRKEAAIKEVAHTIRKPNRSHAMENHSNLRSYKRTYCVHVLVNTDVKYMLM